VGSRRFSSSNQFCTRTRRGNSPAGAGAALDHQEPLAVGRHVVELPCVVRCRVRDTTATVLECRSSERDLLSRVALNTGSPTGHRRACPGPTTASRSRAPRPAHLCLGMFRIVRSGVLTSRRNGEAAADTACLGSCGSSSNRLAELSGTGATAGPGVLVRTTQNIWNNGADPGRLIDADGNVVSKTGG